MDEIHVLVHFSPSTYAALEELAQDHNGSKGHALQGAIALSMWARTIQREGCRILVEKPSGEVKEIVRLED